MFITTMAYTNWQEDETVPVNWQALRTPVIHTAALGSIAVKSIQPKDFLLYT